MTKINLPHEPSLTALFRHAYMGRADKVSCARKPQGLLPAGIFVLLIGDKAVREIGPALLAVARATGSDEPQKILELNPNHSVGLVLDWLRSEQMVWCYGTIMVDQTRCIYAAFVGTPICIHLAEQLTLLGVPTSIT